MTRVRSAWLSAWALLGAWLAPEAAAADQDVGFEQLMQLLSARQHGHAQFVEQQFLAVLKAPLESSGELIYDAPDHLEKRTLLPRAALLQVDGESVTLQRGGRSHVLDLAQHPELAPFVESVRYTLQGDGAGLRRLFEIELTGTLEAWRLALAPRQPRLAALVSGIEVDGSGDELRRVAIRQADGDRSVLTLRPAPRP